MTDVPRRAYPLVVAPPGGFEDAVRRGRRVRRRRAGGTTGAALALVGVLAYSLSLSSAGTSGLQPTDDVPRRQDGSTVVVAPASPSPEPSASVDRPGTAGDPGQRPGTGEGTTVAQPPVTGVPTKPPVRDTRSPKPDVPFAKRAKVTRDAAAPRTDMNTSCLPAAGSEWCARADAVEQDGATGTVYELSYTLCRALDKGDETVTFDREQDVDFATRRTANDDTVWTHSRGYPVVHQAEDVTIPAGWCVRWHTIWDGYDDWRFTPTPGDYEVIARPFAAGLPTARNTFYYGDDDI